MIHFYSPYSGRMGPGYRFCFHVRAITHQPLLLPLVMKGHPKIRLHHEGESPLSVFDCDSILDARLAFSELRKKFDFAYWAATEYYIPDAPSYLVHINDALSQSGVEISRFPQGGPGGLPTSGRACCPGARHSLYMRP